MPGPLSLREYKFLSNGYDSFIGKSTPSKLNFFLIWIHVVKSVFKFDLCHGVSVFLIEPITLTMSKSDRRSAV